MKINIKWIKWNWLRWLVIGVLFLAFARFTFGFLRSVIVNEPICDEFGECLSGWRNVATGIFYLILWLAVFSIFFIEPIEEIIDWFRKKLKDRGKGSGMRTIGYYKEKEVGLDTFHMRRTYGGFLCLSKDSLPSVNQRIIREDIKKNIERIFGENRPIFVMLDDGIDLNLKKKLPPITCYAWLTSYKNVKDESQTYSYLILVWFQKDGDNPFNVLSQKFKKVDWDQRAKDASD